MNGEPQAAQVDERGRVLCDGVMIGRVVWVGGRIHVQLYDKDRRRSSKRGTPYVILDVTSLMSLDVSRVPPTEIDPYDGLPAA